MTNSIPDPRAVEAYWDRPDSVSLIDENLRKLETDFVLSALKPDDDIADLGCGDGLSTVEYAKRVTSVLAVERSATRRANAEALFAEHRVDTVVTLIAGDVFDLSAYPAQFDAVVLQRVLINCGSWESQQEVLNQAISTLKPGGRLILSEVTAEGFARLNEVRLSHNLSPIPQHWHNVFLNKAALFNFLVSRGMQWLDDGQFDLYYWLSRCYVPMFASFTGSGIAAQRDPIFDDADTAARLLQTRYADQVRYTYFAPWQDISPLRGWVWEKSA